MNSRAADTGTATRKRSRDPGTELHRRRRPHPGEKRILGRVCSIVSPYGARGGGDLRVFSIGSGTDTNGCYGQRSEHATTR